MTGVFDLAIEEAQEIFASNKRRIKETLPYSVDFDMHRYNAERLNAMDDWCMKNCEGKWWSSSAFALSWFFERSEEAALFALRWK